MTARNHLSDRQFPDDWYAPKAPEHVVRAALLAGAKHFGTEHVTHNGVAGRSRQVIVHEVTNEKWPSGAPKLGRSIRVAVSKGGRVAIAPDDDSG